MTPSLAMDSPDEAFISNNQPNNNNNNPSSSNNNNQPNNNNNNRPIDNGCPSGEIPIPNQPAGVCYNPEQFVLHGDKTLCPIAQPSLCGSRCFNADTDLVCVNNTLRKSADIKKERKKQKKRKQKKKKKKQKRKLLKKKNQNHNNNNNTYNTT
eukprot:UN04156